MERKLIISNQPKCKTCGGLMKEWNPFGEQHEHIECITKRIIPNLDDIIKKQFKLL